MSSRPRGWLSTANASDAAVRCLEKLGASVAFGIPGMWSLPIYESLASSSIKHVLVRHEEYASYAADGFARASGRFGLCVGTSGPGAVNIAAGLAVPCRDHSPVLALTGQVPTEELGREWIEDMDLASIFKPVTKSTIQLMDASSAYTAVAESYKTAMEGCPGAAHVCYPWGPAEAPLPIRATRRSCQSRRRSDHDQRRPRGGRGLEGTCHHSRVGRHPNPGLGTASSGLQGASLPPSPPLTWAGRSSPRITRRRAGLPWRRGTECLQIRALSAANLSSPRLQAHETMSMRLIGELRHRPCRHRA
jgi:hypothetical protein